MKISTFLTYLCVITTLALYATQAPKEKPTSAKGLPQEIWLDEIICRNLDEEDIFGSIKDIWQKREISKFYRDLITPENIVKCIKKRKLEYIYEQSILQKAIIDYSIDHKEYQLQVITILINGGVDVNLKNKGSGSTALHQAAYSGLTEIARLLLDHGANVNELNFKRHTPLISAILASINTKDDTSDTAKFLISKGADLNVSPNENETVLEYARGLFNILQERKLMTEESGSWLNYKKTFELLKKHLEKNIQILEEAEKKQHEMEIE